MNKLLIVFSIIAILSLVSCSDNTSTTDGTSPITLTKQSYMTFNFNNELIINTMEKKYNKWTSDLPFFYNYSWPGYFNQFSLLMDTQHKNSLDILLDNNNPGSHDLTEANTRLVYYDNSGVIYKCDKSTSNSKLSLNIYLWTNDLIEGDFSGSMITTGTTTLYPINGTFRSYGNF